MCVIHAGWNSSARSRLFEVFIEFRKVDVRFDAVIDRIRPRLTSNALCVLCARYCALEIVWFDRIARIRLHRGRRMRCWRFNRIRHRVIEVADHQSDILALTRTGRVFHRVRHVKVAMETDDLVYDALGDTRQRPLLPKLDVKFV